MGEYSAMPTASRAGYDTREVTPPPLPMIPATVPAATSTAASTVHIAAG